MSAERAGAREWTGLAVLTLPVRLVSMDMTVLHLALPEIAAGLRPSATQALWAVDIYAFMVAGPLITMGAVGAASAARAVHPGLGLRDVGKAPRTKLRVLLSLGAEGASGSAGRTESTSSRPHVTRLMISFLPGSRTAGATGDVLPDLPPRPDLTQLRHQAKDLFRAAAGGDPAAVARIAAVADRRTLASAQLAIAREYGFASWPKLHSEVGRREILNRCDLAQLKALIGEDPSAATEPLEHFCDHRNGAAPLNYVAMLRFDAPRLSLTGALAGTGAIAQALLDAGAPVDGSPGDSETPLMTAASYGDAEVAGVLVDAGADLDALAAPDAGGVPGGSALRHAAVFGFTDVVDVLAHAGARVRSLPEAAAVGDITGWLTDSTSVDDRVRALVMAADHERLGVVDELLAAGTPIDASDRTWGRQALRVAAENGRVAAVRHLLAHGADPKFATAITAASRWSGADAPASAGPTVAHTTKSRPCSLRRPLRSCVDVRPSDPAPTS